MFSSCCGCSGQNKKSKKTPESEEIIVSCATENIEPVKSENQTNVNNVVPSITTTETDSVVLHLASDNLQPESTLTAPDDVVIVLEPKLEGYVAESNVQQIDETARKAESGMIVCGANNGTHYCSYISINTQ